MVRLFEAGHEVLDPLEVQVGIFIVEHNEDQELHEKQDCCKVEDVLFAILF